LLLCKIITTKLILYLEILILTDEKTLKKYIQDFYLNGGAYDEVEIDFGKPQGKEEN